MSALPQDQLASQREFYRQELALSFRYSREFSEPLGSVAEQIADTPEFDRVLGECASGSLDCARRLGEMAVVLLSRVPTMAGQHPWWRDLLHYERSWFLQVATTQEPPPWNRPRRNVSALSASFTWDVPRIVECIKSGKEVSDELHRPVTLLFARGQQGKVCVVEIGAAVERVFRATNSLRTIDQIATTAGVSLEETRKILDALAGIGAILPGMSAAEMTRTLEAREKEAREKHSPQ